MTTNKSNDDNLTSSERAKRHGEVRMLKAIKRKQKYQEPRKRKVLKHNTNDADEDFDDADDDIRDVDFRLYNDAAKLEVSELEFFLIMCFTLSIPRYCLILPKRINCVMCYC